jgi:alkylhydroperoxidase family enzyme
MRCARRLARCEYILRAHFNERQIVELSVLIGLYNMHTRVFTALGIDPEPHHK